MVVNKGLYSRFYCPVCTGKKNIESLSLAGLARVGEMVLAEAFREISFGRCGHLDNVLEHSSVGGNIWEGGQSRMGSDHS